MQRSAEVFTFAFQLQMLVSLALCCGVAWSIFRARKINDGIGDYITIGLIFFVLSWLVGMLIFVPLMQWKPEHAEAFANAGILFRVFVPMLLCARSAWLSGRRPRKFDRQYWLREKGVTSGPLTGEQLVLAYYELRNRSDLEVCEVGKQRWERFELWMIGVGN
jgi:membrane-associated phospholipid phosphatase